MQIVVNGAAREVAEGLTVAELLTALSIEGLVAVEVDHDVVPRRLHAEHVLAAGAQVEIVHLVGGG